MTRYPELEALRANVQLRVSLGYRGMGDIERDLLAGHYARIIRRHPMASSPHWLPRIVRATHRVLADGCGFVLGHCRD